MCLSLGTNAVSLEGSTVVDEHRTVLSNEDDGDLLGVLLGADAPKSSDYVCVVLQKNTLQEC